MYQFSETAAAPRTDERPLLDRFKKVRRRTEELCATLRTEDYVIQSMPDVSPTKWHLAHTSWFFETFLLKPQLSDYQPLDQRYSYLFNSYYVAAGDRHCRQNRGLVSRPTVEEVYNYRRYVDQAMERLLTGNESGNGEWLPVVELGINHEQQHQELLLTDIKHVFWINPLHPVYRNRLGVQGGAPSLVSWRAFPGEIVEAGFEGQGFAYDNEGPRHRVLLQPYEIASRLVTNREFEAFMDDGGYARPELWLSLGWTVKEQEQWQAPLYWIREDSGWVYHTLSGVRPVEESEPVCHVSYFEADAFARWSGARLPTEFEWEAASHTAEIDGNFVESSEFHPLPAALQGGESLQQLFGDLWEWTGSAYLPYPGYEPVQGALGEYNGKFMCNQFVLRGGSCATPADHIRRSYRNFFPPEARWQFSGIRLARSVHQ